MPQMAAFFSFHAPFYGTIGNIYLGGRSTRFELTAEIVARTGTAVARHRGRTGTLGQRPGGVDDGQRTHGALRRGGLSATRNKIRAVSLLTTVVLWARWGPSVMR